MGLFGKKPKHTPIDEESTMIPPEGLDPLRPLSEMQLAAPTPPPAPAPAPAPVKHKKGKTKFSIDPVDFLNLRAELMDMRARLEAAEQAKAIVESRLAALDATTTTLANERSAGGADDVREKLASLESQLAEVAETASVAALAAEDATAAASTAVTTANEAAAKAPTAEGEPDDLAARIDALAARLDEQQEAVAAAPAPTGEPARDEATIARVDELAARLDQLASAPDHTSRLGELEARLSQVAAAQSAPQLAPISSGPDEETLARIDALHDRLAAIEPLADRLGEIDSLAERMGAVDQMAGQLSQLNARVIAQAELGAQLSSLRDRMQELQAGVDDRRAAALAAAEEAELRDRVNGLTDRVAATEGLLNQLGQLAERVSANDNAVRQSTEQVAALEQRLTAVSTELANQLSELGNDIDGLAARAGEASQGIISDELIDGLRTGQIKLANEQARYEIAFRQDLAALAEQVRRPN